MTTPDAQQLSAQAVADLDAREALQPVFDRTHAAMHPEAPEGAGAIFWALWMMAFVCALTFTLGGIYLSRVTGEAGWQALALFGGVMVLFLAAAVWRLLAVAR